MSLINCKECKQLISHTASSCPNCGYASSKDNNKGCFILASGCSGSLVIVIIILIVIIVTILQFVGDLFGGFWDIFFG